MTRSVIGDPRSPGNCFDARTECSGRSDSRSSHRSSSPSQRSPATPRISSHRRRPTTDVRLADELISDEEVAAPEDAGVIPGVDRPALEEMLDRVQRLSEARRGQGQRRPRLPRGARRPHRRRMARARPHLRRGHVRRRARQAHVDALGTHLAQQRHLRGNRGRQRPPRRSYPGLGLRGAHRGRARPCTAPSPAPSSPWRATPSSRPCE